MPNRLEKELSPYLLQHQHNPVDWYPWGKEAFEKAAREDKPVFLSIGYATCHWCHVMEHESFEDKEVAALMNETVVAIKVDREERPDIDQVYMTYCQMTTGQGGWPLTIVMTPDRLPFFAATYLPRQSRHGRIGMKEMLPRVLELWRNQKSEIQEAAHHNAQLLQKAGEWEAGGDRPGESVLTAAFEALDGRYDTLFGGFGSAPKFPSPHQLIFLLRFWKRNGEQQALEMVRHTLLNMRRGGLFDHIGFGFHRYSTDAEWLLPHFEKMLYDQALIVLASLEAFEATHEDAFREIVEKTITYVLRDMTSEAGGFYSAEDADSEGVEGKFYVWTHSEVLDILGEEQAQCFMETYQFEQEGNYKEEATGHLMGNNIPHLQDFYHVLDEDGEDVLDNIEIARKHLFEVRKLRIHPLKDDKILTDWNGLMIAAMARAGHVLQNPVYTEAAIKAADFIYQNMTDADGRLLHRYRNGKAGLQSNIDDYAFLIWGLLELYDATFDVDYLKWALNLEKRLNTHFWDAEHGAYFFTPDDGEELIVRQKEAYDGAAPSGNSVMVLNLLRLGRVTGETRFDEQADTLLRTFTPMLQKQPSGFTAMLVGLDNAIGPAREIVVVGEPEASGTKELLHMIRSKYIPNKVVLLKSEACAADLAGIAPFTEGMQALNGKATVYVCENYHCNQPVTSTKALQSLLAI